MFVNSSNVGHDRLPIRSIGRGQLFDIQCSWNANRLGGTESYLEIAAHVGRRQGINRDHLWQILVQESAKGKTVVPRTAEIRDVYVRVGCRLGLTPFQQGIAFRAAILHKAG